MDTLSQRDYHFIVQDNSILAFGNQLPFSENPYHFWQSCESANHLHDLHLSTLRCLHIIGNDEYMYHLYAQEYHGGALPEGYRWLNCAELNTLESPFENLAGYWESLSDSAQAEWYQLGFYEKIAPLFTQNLEQLRSWERSAVWRMGEQYLKLVPPMFQHEIPLCHWLQAHFPENSARVFESPAGMLMADYGKISLFQRLELPVWEEAMRVYARMQIGTLGHKTELLDLGLPLRSLEWLEAGIDAFFADDAMLRNGLYPVSEEEIARLRAAIPRLHEACKKLATYQIPLSLEHGDLWAGQIIVQNENILITDWSDSAWTHPLFSIVFFLAEIHNDLPNEPDGFEGCKQAFLAEWTEFEPMEHLQEAYQEADLLSPLYTALRYYYDVLPNMRQRWEMENMINYNLRLLLKALG